MAFKNTSNDRGLPFDYVLYTNYERQVKAHVRRTHRRRLEFAPGVAAVGEDRRAAGRRAEAICMRDTDRDLTSIIVVRAGSGIRHASQI